MPKLKKFRVEYLSLLRTESPANRKRVIVKSSDGSRFRFEFALKNIRKDAKRGLAYCTVYEPEEMDTQKDWTGVEEILDASHSFMIEKRTHMVDSDHDYVPSEDVVVESSIKNGPDDRYPDTKDGSWVVCIKLANPEDEIKGLSMAGGGIYDNAALPPKAKSKLRKDGFRNKGEEATGDVDAQGDATPEQLIQNLKDAGQWPANYDDDSDGATMSDIFACIQECCDDKGMTVGSGTPVLDALASKLMSAPPDSTDGIDPSTVDPSTQKSVTRIRPLKGNPSGTRLRINHN